MRTDGFPMDAAMAALRERISHPPEVFVVLGSGLGNLAEGVEEAVTIPFREVPGFPGVGVAGHHGCLVSGFLKGKRVLVQAGRFHFYEGSPASVVVAPIRLAAALGTKVAILTNAAGGIARALNPGCIMLLDDHLNLMGRSPLEGPVQGSEERFPDMSEPFDGELQRKALDLAAARGIPLHRGTYAAVLGPSYETPAEIRYLAGMGAHAVGMSTVPEVITARALGLSVVGFSLITNRAAGMGQDALDHQEVLEMGETAGERLGTIVGDLIRTL